MSARPAQPPVPIAVVMLSLNEAHNMEAVLDNLSGWAQEIFLVDSYSADDTVGIALRRGVQVVQRRFRGFGEQWNFALSELPITAPWTMKLDPDERLSPALKDAIASAIGASSADGFEISRRLWFMGEALPIRQKLLRVWRTGRCRFTDVLVNEYPIVEGKIAEVAGDLDHHDSPDLSHWVDKQNRYSTAEAVARYEGRALAAEARLTGTPLQRRMWLKRNFWRMPGRYWLMLAYHLWVARACRPNSVGWIWARLRTNVYYRMIEYKTEEMRRLGRKPVEVPNGTGQPDPRVKQYD